VARRTGAEPSDLTPQTVAWLMLGAALAAYEHWLGPPTEHDASTTGAAMSLRQALAEAFDTAAAGLTELS
jgi:hypothetical protein